MLDSLPFYSVLKLVLIVSLLLPSRNATRSVVFSAWIDPWLGRYEARVTGAMRVVRQTASDTMSQAVRKLMHLALDRAVPHLSAEELQHLSNSLSATSQRVKNENTKRLSESVRNLFAPLPASSAATTSSFSSAPIEAAAAPELPAPSSSLSAAKLVSISEHAPLSSVPASASNSAPAAAQAEVEHDKENQSSVEAQKAIDVQRLMQRVKPVAAPPAPASSTASAEGISSDASIAVRRSKRTAAPSGTKPTASTSTTSAAARAAKLKRQSIL